MKSLTVMLSAAALVLSVALPGMARAEDDGPATAPYPGGILYSGTGMPVVFSHEMHVGGMGFTCDACHTEIFELEAGAAKERGDFNMRAMQDGDYCGKCHDGETAFSSGDFAYCQSCHSGPGGEQPLVKVVGPEETITLGFDAMAADFRHSSHGPFACNRCHTALFPIKKTGTITSMDEINSGKACGVCHNGAAAFDATNCSSCHPRM